MTCSAVRAGLSFSGGGTHEYAMWDAAYVLGSPSSVERRAYEAHLSTCPSCREAGSELDGPLSATVSLSGPDWGTRIEMNCTFGVGLRTPTTTATRPATPWRWWRWDATAATPSRRPGWRSPGCPRRRAAAARSRWTKSLLYKSFLRMREMCCYRETSHLARW